VRFSLASHSKISRAANEHAVERHAQLTYMPVISSAPSPPSCPADPETSSIFACDAEHQTHQCIEEASIRKLSKMQTPSMLQGNRIMAVNMYARYARFPTRHHLNTYTPIHTLASAKIRSCSATSSGLGADERTQRGTGYRGTECSI
jgi:hypothetical protein